MTAAAVVASSADAFLRALAQRAPSHADRPSCCSPSASAASPAAARRRHAGLARRRGPAPLAAAGASSSSSSSSSDGGERLDALQQRANQIRAMKAAANYLELLKDEDVDLEDEEEVVARSLGMKTKAELSPTQRKYAERIAQSLAEARFFKAAAMERKQAEEKKVMLAGQRLFEVGQYAASVELFEKALKEVALWLALAYDAAGRRDDALDVYRRLEDTHPSAKVKKQAYGLRFILEAPELEISPEERVKIPVGVEGADDYTDKWSRNSAPKRKVKMTWEDEFWEKYEPPAALTNRYVLAATSVLSLGVAIYSAMHIRRARAAGVLSLVLFVPH